MGRMNIKSLFRRRLKLRSKSSGGSTGNGSGSGVSDPSSAAASPTSGELERVFDKFDSNGDGKISADELAAIFATLGDGHPLTDEELLRIMAEADSDGDGFISLDEFIDLNTIKVDPTAALEDLRHAFSMFDLDRNGCISAEELAKVLRSLGEGVSVAQCRKMIDGVDKDGDGMVSFEEFKVMMTGSGSGGGGIMKITGSGTGGGGH